MSSELIKTFRELVISNTVWADAVRSTASKYLIPLEGTEDHKDPKKMADGVLATEVVVSVVTLFKAMLEMDVTANVMALMDLSFGLNSNLFWTRNANYLVPVLTTAQLAALDYIVHVEDNNLAHRELQYHNRFAWLDVVVSIAFLVRGFPYTKSVSQQLKKDIMYLITTVTI